MNYHKSNKQKSSRHNYEVQSSFGTGRFIYNKVQLNRTGKVRFAKMAFQHFVETLGAEMVSAGGHFVYMR